MFTGQEIFTKFLMKWFRLNHKNTRLAVEFIIELLANGWTEEEIFHNYPGITHEDILACLQYADATLKTEKVYSLPIR